MKNLLLVICFIISTLSYAQKPELVVPVGHSNSISTIAFVPNSDFVATGSDDNTIILWNIKTKQKIRTFEGHQERVLHISIHPKGHLMASCSWDHTIRIWEIATGKVVKQIHVHYGIRILSFTADGKNLISESSTDSIDVRKWNTTNWKLEKEIDSKFNKIYASILQITPNNRMVRHILSYGKEGKIDTSQFIVSDYEDRAIFKSKNLPNNQTACISNNGEWIVIGGENTVEIINLISSKNSRDYSYAGRIERICFSDDSKKIAIYSERNYYDSTQQDKIAILGLSKGEWRLLSERTTKNFENNDECFAFTNNNMELISGIKDTSHGNLYIWNYTTSKEDNLYTTTRSIYTHDIVSKLGICKETSNYESFARTQTRNRISYDSLLSNLHKIKIDTSLYTFFSNFEVYQNKKKNITVSEFGHYIKKNDNIKGATYSSFSIMRITNFNKDTLIKNLKLPSFNSLRDVFFIQNGKYLVIQSVSEFSIIDTINWNEISRVEGKISSPVIDLDKDNKSVAIWRGDFFGGRWLTVQSLLEGKLLLDYKTENESIEVNAAKIIGSKSKVAVTFSDKTLKIFDLSNQYIEKVINLPAIDYEIYGFTDTTEKYLILTNLDNDFNSLQNQLLIVDWEKGEIVSQIYPVDSTDWVITCPEGYFDASPGAMQKMYYVQGLETFDLEQLKERFWHPSLLNDLLTCGKGCLQKSLFDYNIPLPPTINLSIKGESLNIALQARDGGVGKVSLFLNGREIIEDLRKNGKDDVDKKALNYHLAMSSPFIEGFLEPDIPNIFKVIAYERNDEISTSGDTISFVLQNPKFKGIPVDKSTPKEEAKAKNMSFYAIVIGANTLGLRYADTDARAFKSVLENTAKQFIDTTKGNKIDIRLFCSSQTNAALRPTRENILTYLRYLTTVAKKEDYFCFYFSGHGKVFESINKNSKTAKTDFAMLLHRVNSATKLDKNLSEYVRQNLVITMRDELVPLLNAIPARKQVHCVDACGSEQAALLATNGAKDILLSKEKAFDNMKSRTGRYFLASSAKDKVSYENSTFQHGFMTYTLLQGLNSDRTIKYFGKEAYLDVASWFKYAESETPKLAASVGQVQIPKFWTPSQQNEDIFLGIVNDELRKQISLPNNSMIQFSGYSNFQQLNSEDPLNLTDKFKGYLREKSELDPSIFMYDDTPSINSYALRGTYRKENEKIIFENIGLFKNKTRVKELGRIEKQNVDELIKELFETLIQSIK